ncbi:diguanylate cyclase domain-containing protein [Lysobacter humi (ex Lee et al. 2017)]
MSSWVDALAPSSIRRQLIVTVAAVLAVLTTAFITSQVLRQRAALAAEHAQRTGGLAAGLAAQLGRPLGRGDARAAQAVLDGLRSLPGLRHAVVFDRAGRRIAGSRGTSSALPSPGLAPARPHSLVESAAFVEIAMPVRRGGRHVGWLRLATDSPEAARAVDRALGEGIIAALAAIAIGTAFAHALGHRVTRRLYGLLEVADATREGRRDLRARASRVHEVARLADSFNAMLDALAEREQALARSNEELEARVEERTAELAESAANQRAILEQANDAFIMVDEDGRVVEWNRAARTIFGFTRSQAIGRLLTDLIIPEAQHAAHTRGMRRYLETGETSVVGRRVEMLACTRDGREIPVEMSMRSRYRGQQRYFDAFLRDITERKQLEVSLAMQALHDSLTGLPNRRLLLESLPRAIQRADRSGTALGVYFLDLDGFKQVNDTLGHDAGDAVLCEFACRIRDAVRAVDMVARLAGDEFVVVAEAFSNPQPDAMTVAAKLVRVGEAPYVIGDTERRLSSSVGVAIYLPGSGVDTATLLHRADEAMYASKHGGKARATVWAPAPAGVAAVDADRA